MKNILIIGGTGTSGIGITEETLKKGMNVFVLSRSGQIELKHEKLTIIKGDSNNREDVKNAMKGKDVIISAVGNRDYQSPVLVCYPTLHNIIECIKPDQRLISVGAPSILQADENTLVRYTYGKEMIDFLRYPLIDHFVSYELLKFESNCNWLFVCPPMIEKGETQEYVIKENYFPEKCMKNINSNSIGDFIANEIVENKFSKTRIGIGISN